MILPSIKVEGDLVVEFLSKRSVLQLLPTSEITLNVNLSTKNICYLDLSNLVSSSIVLNLSAVQENVEYTFVVRQHNTVKKEATISGYTLSGTFDTLQVEIGEYAIFQAYFVSSKLIISSLGGSGGETETYITFTNDITDDGTNVALRTLQLPALGRKTSVYVNVLEPTAPNPIPTALTIKLPLILDCTSNAVLIFVFKPNAYNTVLNIECKPSNYIKGLDVGVKTFQIQKTEIVTLYSDSNSYWL